MAIFAPCRSQPFFILPKEGSTSARLLVSTRAENARKSSSTVKGSSSNSHAALAPTSSAASSSSSATASGPTAVPMPSPLPPIPESLEDSLSIAAACVISAWQDVKRQGEPMTFKERSRMPVGMSGRQGVAKARGKRKNKEKTVRGEVSDASEPGSENVAPSVDAVHNSAASGPAYCWQVEVPVRDESAETMAGVALSLLGEIRRQLPLHLRAGLPAATLQATVLFGDEDGATVATAAADAASEGSAKGSGSEQGRAPHCLPLCPASVESVPCDTSLIIAVAPAASQALALQQLTSKAASFSSPLLLLLPATADGVGSPAAAAPAVTASDLSWPAFEVVYCFLPLAIKGLFGSSEGALVHCRAVPRAAAKGGTRSSGAGKSPWVVFMQREGSLRPCAALASRPDAAELENLMYAASAATSPLAKSVNFMRSLMGGGKV